MVNRRAGKSRTVLIGLAVVVVLAGAVYAFDRVAVSVTGEGPLSVFKPSVSDVLDGSVAKDKRESALAGVGDGLGTVEVGDATEIGRQLYLKCVRGANDWKSKAGFRLRCSASGRVYSAWSGDYETGHDSIRAAMDQRCARTEPVGGESPPSSWVPRRDTYECSDGARVMVAYASTERGITAVDSAIDRMATQEMRQIAGSDLDEVDRKLSDYRWFAVHYFNEVYYEDQP